MYNIKSLILYMYKLNASLTVSRPHSRSRSIKGAIRKLPIKWWLNGCPLLPTASLIGGGSLAERVLQDINSH